MNISDKSLLFATAFYHAEGRSPNAWTFSERSKLDMYYRCMVVCYASIRRLYPEAQMALFSNRELPEPFNSQLKSLEVRTMFCASCYVDDTAFKNGFPGCLFTLDVIEHLAYQQNDFSHLILLDSDCIVRDRLDGLLDKLESNEETVYAYEPGYPTNMVANGQSRASLTLALSYFSGQMIAPPVPLYGGEFYALSAKSLEKLAMRIAVFWEWMKAEGIQIFGDNLTEEHVMSVVLAQSGNNVHGASALVKRIWTAAVFSTVNGIESGIPIWHLPSEKKKGFVKLYQHWLDYKGFAGLNNDDFKRLVDNHIPLHVGGRKYPGRTALLRLRNAGKVLVTGRL